MGEHVNLIWVTPEAERMILRCARVSSPNPDSEETGLINFLIRNKHWSPFEMANMCLEITTTRMISQQIIRHRSFSFQEFSQRYAEVANFEYTEPRVKGDTNRQGSLSCEDPEVREWWNEQQLIQNGTAFDTYREALKRGIAPEVARSILPGASITKMYMNGTLRSWIHYFSLRCDSHTQKEHRVIALEAQQYFINMFPILSEALWPKNA